MIHAMFPVNIVPVKIWKPWVSIRWFIVPVQGYEPSTMDHCFYPCQSMSLMASYERSRAIAVFLFGIIHPFYTLTYIRQYFIGNRTNASC